jgi:hypothetical protein
VEDVVVDELDGVLTPVSVRLGVEELATLDAVAAEWRVSRSGVFRRLLLSAPRAAPAAGEAGAAPALGRVPLGEVTVRPESVAWIDARGLAWGWDRVQVVRLLLSEGRRVVERKHAKASAGESVPGWGPRERVVDGSTREPDEAPVDVVDAPVPA